MDMMDRLGLVSYKGSWFRYDSLAVGRSDTPDCSFGLVWLILMSIIVFY